MTSLVKDQFLWLLTFRGSLNLLPANHHFNRPLHSQPSSDEIRLKFSIENYFELQTTKMYEDLWSSLTWGNILQDVDNVYKSTIIQLPLFLSRSKFFFINLYFKFIVIDIINPCSLFLAMTDGFMPLCYNAMQWVILKPPYQTSFSTYLPSGQLKAGSMVNENIPSHEG